MSMLFEKTAIKGVELRNRFVRSATWEGMASDDGFCTVTLKDFYVELAKGKVGLIITGHTYVLPEGMGSPRQLGLSDDKFIPGCENSLRPFMLTTGERLSSFPMPAFWLTPK